MITGISSIAVSVILWKQALADGNVSDIKDESVPVGPVYCNGQPQGMCCWSKASRKISITWIGRRSAGRKRPSLLDSGF